MRMLRTLAVSVVVLGVSIGTIMAQAPPGGGAPGGGAGKGGGGGGGKGGGRGGRGGLAAPMTITVTGYTDGGMIPDSIGCGAAGMQKDSPKIDWTGAPAGTMAFAMILHDADMVIPPANVPDILHWAIFDIPGTATGLPAGVPKMAMLADGSVQPNNIAGMPGFYSPCPPAPTTHHYIIEVYALDAKLGLPATTSRADLLAALAMHTRAKGTYVGIYHV
jgi:Raf kinase inhibitor-like YbhB/YbcL family protein